MFINYSEKHSRQIISEEVQTALALNLTKAIEDGVTNALRSFGADTDNIQEVQRDFHYLRRKREAAEDIRRNIFKTVISVVLGGLLVAGFEIIKQYLH